MGEIRVTDKRMFTPDGRLREEFERELAAPSAAEEPSAESTAPTSTPEPSSSAAAPPVPEPAPAAAPATADAASVPTLPPGLDHPPPGLLELVEFLAGWSVACMGEMPLPDGRLVRDLDAARFYIDLLGALRDRFGRGLSPQELHFVESYLDQLRLRYVSRTG